MSQFYMRCETCGSTCKDDGINDDCRDCRRKKKESSEEDRADYLRDQMLERRGEYR